MCSISGFSFTPTSNANARSVTAALLRSGQSRGTDATGFATVSSAERIVVSTRNMHAAAFLDSKDFWLSRSATEVIAHTRYATQGSPKDPMNNHPVCAFTPDRHEVALVHNGCIDNDYELFESCSLPRYGQVDSEILPALLAEKGSDAYADVLGTVQGSVACAWLDERTGRTLHLARACSSPVMVVAVDAPRKRKGVVRRGPVKGVIFASTTAMINAALDALGLRPDSPFVTAYQLREGEYMSVTQGVWSEQVHPFTLPKRRVYRDWRTGFATGPSTSRSRSEARQWASFGGFSEGYDSAFGGRYTSHNGVLHTWDDTDMIDSVAADLEAETDAAEADYWLHADYCAENFCVLDDDAHCPVVSGLVAPREAGSGSYSQLPDERTMSAIANRVLSRELER